MMTNVLDSNRFGGSFSKLWEVQAWADEHDYGPDDWEWSEQTREKFEEYSHKLDPEEAKRRVDEREFTVPCGERVFTRESVETYGHVNEDRGLVEADVVAECVECGFKHTASKLLTPAPNT